MGLILFQVKVKVAWLESVIMPIYAYSVTGLYQYSLDGATVCV